MTTGSLGGDHITRALATLSKLEPDPRRAAQTRSRCHAALSQPDRKRLLAGFPARLAWCQTFEPDAAGLASAIYLAEVLRRAWLLYGFQ